MHAAGYALDPEFMQMSSDMDTTTQNGLISIIEKMSMLEERIEGSKLGIRDGLTMESEKV
eukprot:7176141-Prymnesium_polylepis.1